MRALFVLLLWAILLVVAWPVGNILDTQSSGKLF